MSQLQFPEPLLFRHFCPECRIIFLRRVNGTRPCRYRRKKTGPEALRVMDINVAALEARLRH